MKIYMGPYRNRISAYSFLEPFEKFLGESRVDKAYDVIQPVLNGTINRFLERERKIKIRIDDYDVWNADVTISMILVPMLKRLKENKVGTPHVDDEDVPEELRSTNYPLSEEAKSHEEPDEKHHERWDWVLDEMIWTFEQSASDQWENPFFKDDENGVMRFDREGYKNTMTRIKNGHRLFGKYFFSLWD